MRMRSTGLGKTELCGQIDGLDCRGEEIILSVRTTAPVKWHIRTVLSPLDLVKILGCALKPRFLFQIVGILLRSIFNRGNVKEPCRDY